MYVYAVPPDRFTARVDFDPGVEPDEKELYYWRKHPNLHGWMESLYWRKGGRAEVFNCVYLELTREDLEELEMYVRENALPMTTGPFFGSSHNHPVANDLEFIQLAHEALSQGLKLVYEGSW